MTEEAMGDNARARRFWTDEDTAAVRSGFAAGEPIASIAARLDRSATSVGAHAKRLKIKHMGERVIWTEEVLQRTYRLLCEGYSYGEIAKMYGVTKIAVRSRCNATWVGAAAREKLGVTKSKPVRFWTKERRDELARMYRLEWPLKKMAKALGVTLQSIRHQAAEQGLSDRERGARIMGAQRRGKKHSAKAIAVMSEKAKARWQRPDYVKKQSAIVKSEHMATISRIANDRRRGFSIPDDKLADYRTYRDNGYSPAEAGEALGLVQAVAA
ncbi:hypothetical protein DYI37_03255 [Fulvimarina endophytica]|uniref:Uncharacterized protein n=1 Tax=Fulvimarina endophytica TaxID=2293836 RepID=A0A371XB62_9HYPH|nr:hypothetical protein [Fulvimarina endophytica]RFC66473.1 hypothetical protein DYI37_03255 [Fulvimarina endophytica]